MSKHLANCCRDSCMLIFRILSATFHRVSLWKKIQSNLQIPTKVSSGLARLTSKSRILSSWAHLRRSWWMLTKEATINKIKTTIKRRMRRRRKNCRKRRMLSATSSRWWLSRLIRDRNNQQLSRKLRRKMPEVCSSSMLIAILRARQNHFLTLCNVKCTAKTKWFYPIPQFRSPTSSFTLAARKCILSIRISATTLKTHAAYSLSKLIVSKATR